MTDRTQSAFTSGTILGIALVVLGVGSWVLTDFASLTALIPALFGILVVGFASMGQETDRERLALYGIAAVGALGVLGSLRVVPDVFALLAGEGVDSIVGVASQVAMIAIGLALVVLVFRAVLAEG